MAATVTVRREEEIALLVIDNPPVNALSHALREALVAALAEAEADPAIEGIVIAARGRTFIAGADIAEFDRPPQEPTTGQLVARLAALRKPVAAALHGSVLGGGLEVALACHLRVMAREAVIGLPEIRLGLIPGSGGTVRLPRLVGADRALELIASGRSVGAAEALALGIVHALADGPVDERAIAILRARNAIDKIRKKADGDERAGMDIVYRAVAAPIKQIAANCGLDLGGTGAGTSTSTTVPTGSGSTDTTTAPPTTTG